MATIRLDKQGRLGLPAELIGSHHWRAGTEFSIEDRPEGLLLRPLRAHPKTAKARADGHHGSTGHASTGRDSALADAVRDRYAKLGH
jgi:hypothetical protein